MAHKFDPKKLDKLEDPKRLRIFNPDSLFKELGLGGFDSILDFGVGTGFYLPYLTRLLTASGLIYAVDVQDELLAFAQEKLKGSPFENKVRFLKIEEKKPLPFESDSLDFIYLAFTFHELSAPQETLRELYRLLRPGGKLLLIDWNKEKRDMGPPPEEVYAEAELLKFFESEAFYICHKRVREPYIFIILAEKK